MATVSNAIVLKATGVDATGRMLRSLSARIGAFSGMVSAISQRALSSVGDTIREMASLSDRAADARTSAEDLQRLSTAMQQLGVRGASVETVSRAMQEMTRRTGEEGTQGFMRILTAIAQVNDAQQRATLLAEAFGRQGGASLAVLVDNGVQGLIDGLGQAADGIAVASNESVAACDMASDMWTLASKGLQAGFTEAIGSAFDYLNERLNLGAVNVSQWGKTIVKWAWDAFRAVYYAGKWLGTALRGVLMELFAPLKAIGKAAWAALHGDFEGALDHLRNLPGEMADIANDISGELSDVFPDDLFQLPAAKAGEKMRDSIRDGAEDAQNTLEKLLKGRAAVETAKAAGKAFSQAARSFAGFIGFGSNEARKTAFSRNVDPIERAMLETARRNLDAVESIADTVAEIGVA